MDEQANKQANKQTNPENRRQKCCPELENCKTEAQHKNPLRQIGFVNQHNGHINIGQNTRERRYPAGSRR